MARLETEERNEKGEAEGLDDADDSSEERHKDDGEVDKGSSADDEDSLQDGPDDLTVEESDAAIDEVYGTRKLTRHRRGE